MALCGSPALPACGDDDTEAFRECAPTMFDAAGGEYPTRDCMPAAGEQSPVGFHPGGTCHGDDPPSIIFHWGRFFEACSGCGSGTTSDLCRPLVCEDDEDCPRFENTRFVDGRSQPFEERFECRNGICQSDDLESHPLDTVYSREAEMLCLAPLDRGERYDGPAACPGVDPYSVEPCPLPLPDGCLQP